MRKDDVFYYAETSIDIGEGSPEHFVVSGQTIDLLAVDVDLVINVSKALRQELNFSMRLFGNIFSNGVEVLAHDARRFIEFMFDPRGR